MNLQLVRKIYVVKYEIRDHFRTTEQSVSAEAEGLIVTDPYSESLFKNDEVRASISGTIRITE